MTTSAACAGMAISKAMPMLAETPSADGWKTYEVTARVEVLKPSGATHIWLPAALIRNTPYQKTLSNKYVADGGTANLTENQQDALGNRFRRLSGGREAGADADQRCIHQELLGGFVEAIGEPQGLEGGVGVLPAAQQVRSDRRRRAGNRA